MTESMSFRKHFHEIANKLQGIAVNSRGFAYIYGDAGMINENTINELSKVMSSVEAYYKKTVVCVGDLNDKLRPTPAFPDWRETERKIQDELCEIRDLIITVRKIESSVRAETVQKITSAAKELNKLQGKCETVTGILSDFKTRLVALGIYDDIA